ncbi:hypothetical protein [Alteribacillus sp. HJP-4]|uniref:hypothetical protein n=1 Tax=Alteribacillus sp. HJP-4 TaxID=2775394 RepID=UPI0035CD2E52
MTAINIDKKTAAWVIKNGASVTLDPIYPFNQTKERGPVDVMLTFETPENSEKYDVTEDKGIYYYIHRKLYIKKELRLRISGFGPFQHLSCSGVSRFKKKSQIVSL